MNLKPETASLSLYQLDLRNFTKEGTIRAALPELKRIRSLGFGAVLLLPIHPIGKLDRIGEAGSPYSIADYAAVRPELGTLSDFDALLNEAHRQGLKVLMDIVMSHTSKDHPYHQTHPEFYRYDAAGKIQVKYPMWSDIHDLNYDCPALHEALCDMLEGWVRRGVDGFRCDVASSVPVTFWEQARKRSQAVNPDFLWLAESCEPEYIRETWRRGYFCHTDSELAAVFDISYDYDVYSAFKAVFEDPQKLPEYKRRIAFQDVAYPADHLKLHFLENHDQPRIAHCCRGDRTAILNWLAYSFFIKGTAMIYMGQECLAENRPSITKKNPADLSAPDAQLCAMLCRLNALRPHPLRLRHEQFVMIGDDQPAIAAYFEYQQRRLWGVFNVLNGSGPITVDCADGQAVNLLNQQPIQIVNHQLQSADCPAVFESDAPVN